MACEIHPCSTLVGSSRTPGLIVGCLSPRDMCSFKGPSPPTFHSPSPHLPSAAYPTWADSTWTAADSTWSGDFIPEHPGLLADGPAMEILMSLSHSCICLFIHPSPHHSMLLFVQIVEGWTMQVPDFTQHTVQEKSRQ